MTRLCFFVLAACGPAEPSIQARISTQAPLELSQIKSVEVFLLSGTTLAGDAIGCADLAGAAPLERDDLVSRGHVFSPLQDLVIERVVHSDNLIVLAQGFDNDTGTGVPIATACSEGLSVRAGHTADVALTFVPI